MKPLRPEDVPESVRNATLLIGAAVSGEGDPAVYAEFKGQSMVLEATAALDTARAIHCGLAAAQGTAFLKGWLTEHAPSLQEACLDAWREFTHDYHRELIFRTQMADLLPLLYGLTHKCLAQAEFAELTGLDADDVLRLHERIVGSVRDLVGQLRASKAKASRPPPSPGYPDYAGGGP